MTIEEKVMELYNKFDHDIAVHNIVALVEEACAKQKNNCYRAYLGVDMGDSNRERKEIYAIKNAPEPTWEERL
jgi:hypothetical protein